MIAVAYARRARPIDLIEESMSMPSHRTLAEAVEYKALLTGTA